MKIKIKPNASALYAQELNRMVPPHGVWPRESKAFWSLLLAVNGKTLEVETEHLFDDQFNTAPIPGISETGLRVMAESVEEVIDDVRPGKMRCRWCGTCSDTSNFCPKCGKDDYLRIFKTEAGLIIR